MTILSLLLLLCLLGVIYVYLKTGYWELVIACSLYWAAFLMFFDSVPEVILFGVADLAIGITYLSLGFRQKDNFWVFAGFLMLFMAAAHLIP